MEFNFNNPLIVTTLVTAVTNVCTYFVTKKKKQNDFINDLQSSIDLLSEKYTCTLKELVVVKESNVQLTCKINELIQENKSLKDEVSKMSIRCGNGTI